jgi:hypothetical protein
MPIGSSKLGVLGAGLVPGGTETFNAPGTFSIPPGVKKVSITGVGGKRAILVTQEPLGIAIHYCRKVLLTWSSTEVVVRLGRREAEEV